MFIFDIDTEPSGPRLFQELGDTAGLAQPLSDLGLLAYSQGDHAETRVRLDEATIAAAWAEERAMPLEQAIVYALDNKD